jgi:hypothetical protein
MHLAFWYLGVVDDPGLFWPDDQGGNAWSSEPPAS